MADYSPEFVPGNEITSTASASITGGQVLAVSGSGTVAPAGVDSNAVVGVAAFDAATNGEITVFARGITHISTASGAITAGDRVNSGAAGTVATGVAAVTNIGIALTTAADGASVTWMEI